MLKCQQALMKIIMKNAHLSTEIQDPAAIPYFLWDEPMNENRFFLTGGAALAGFYLGHRETHDLDLFTLMDAMEEGSAAVVEAAREMGAKLESIQSSPDFR
jgi:hypothetical protein